MKVPKLYADSPARRARQVTADVFVVLWVLAWWGVARGLYDATLALARPGRELTEAGDGLAARMRDAADAAGSTPLVGDRLSQPFSGAVTAADKIASAGVAQVEAVETLATVLGLAVFALPVLAALALHLPLRFRFVREATAAQRHIDSAADLDLFALRALARQPMHVLARVSTDPAEAWRSRDREVIRRLALVELEDVGLRPPG